MATIRALMIAGAVVLHTAALAHAQRAPLQLVPGDGQATRAGETSTVRKSAPRPQTKKAATKASKNRTAQPTAKNASKTATATTRDGNLARARAVQNRAAQRAIAAALPDVRAQDASDTHASDTMSFAPRPSQQTMDVAQRSKAARAQALPEQAAREPNGQEKTSSDNVMRDGDSISLVGRLPWWRNNSLQPITYGSEEAESQVMAAADAWLLANAQVPAETRPPAENSPVIIADANELNELDRAASADPVMTSAPAPAVPTFAKSLIAILAGAAAAVAVAAASARLLFA